MGSKEFQMEYIQYLQENNTKLMKKISEMQESFENKVCSTDISKQYILSTLEETLNICTVLPQEIDAFNEKIKGAIITLKSILIKKSELLQIAQKISQIIEPYKKTNGEILESSSFSHTNLNFNSSGSEKKDKGGTAKVSPMLNGNIISTEPKTYLNRISKMQALQQLSPILEASPGGPSESPKHQVRSSPNNYCHKELKTPLEKYFKEKTEKDQIKKKFQLPRNQKKNLTEERNSDFGNSNRINETSVLQENNESELQNKSEIDPLEGSSWLYRDSCDISNSNNGNFVNTRKRRNPFADVVCKLENIDYSELENYMEPLDILKEPIVKGFNKETSEKDSKDFNEKTSEKDSKVFNKEASETDSEALSIDISLNNKKDSVLQQSNSSRQNSFQYNENIIKKNFIDSELKDQIIKNQPIVKLEDCLINKKNSQSLSNISTQTETSENISGSFKCDSHFYNTTISDEGEGRKKRKAAPKNLTEPKLKTKLRRE